VVTTARSVCLVLVVGCASPASALREDNRRLTETVTELRSERRAQERELRDLQHQLDDVRAKLASPSSEAPPPLPIEVAAPPPTGEPSRVVGVADDGTEIVYEGAAIAARTVPIDDAPAPEHHAAPRASQPLPDVPAASDRIEVTHHVPSIATASPQIAARTTKTKVRDHDAPSDATNDYRSAVELVKSGKHVEAIAALRAFLAHYPKHDYADNAQYWIGEAYYAQKDFTHALGEFRTVVEKYPRGNKVPDALLKVGYCYQALGQAEKAHAMLQQVVSLYPKTEPAALAAKRLETP
jgi:tol-pal system protein YbgF